MSARRSSRSRSKPRSKRDGEGSGSESESAPEPSPAELSSEEEEFADIRGVPATCIRSVGLCSVGLHCNGAPQIARARLEERAAPGGGTLCRALGGFGLRGGALGQLSHCRGGTQAARHERQAGHTL